MKKILILLTLLIFISGCIDISSYTKSPIYTKKDTPTETSQQFLSGDDGVIFVISYPEKEVYVGSGTPFSPKVEVSNMGESDTRGELCLGGLDENLFTGYSDCECNSYSLEKVLVSGDGGVSSAKSESISFGPYVIDEKKLPTTAIGGEQKATIPYLISFYNTFSYNTNSILNICIPKSGNVLCESNKKPTFKSSASPIKIGTVEQQVIPKSDGNAADIILIIKIENKGKGTLASSETEGCLFDDETVKFIYVEDYPANIQGGTMICENAEFKTKKALNDFNKILGGKEIKCTIKDVKLTNDEPVETIDLKFSYNYHVTSLLNFEMKK